MSKKYRDIKEYIEQSNVSAEFKKEVLEYICEHRIQNILKDYEELRNGIEHVAAWMDRCHKLEIKINELQHILNNIQIVDGRLLITGEMRKYVKPLKESEVEGDI